MGKKSLVSAIIMATISWSSLSFALTDEHKKEVYNNGTLTIKNHDGVATGRFEIQIIPGALHVKEDAERHLKSALETLKELSDKQGFWHDKILGSLETGFDILKTHAIEGGVCSIPSDFKETLHKNNDISGFASKAAKIKNWITFGVDCVGRVVETIYGVGGSAIYSITVPTGQIILRPISAASEALLAGTLWPAIRFAWNGTAWIMLMGDQEPTPGQTSMFISYIPLYTQPAVHASEDRNDL